MEIRHPQNPPSTLIKVCAQFLNDPAHNPRTGRKITRGGPTYKALINECKDITNIPASISGPEVHVSISGPEVHVDVLCEVAKFLGENGDPDYIKLVTIGGVELLGCRPLLQTHFKQAVRVGDKEILSAMMKKRAVNPYWLDDVIKTAIKTKNQDMLRFLIDKTGIDDELRYGILKRTMSIAKEKKSLNMIKFLVSMGIDVDEHLISIAKEKKSLNMIKFLVSMGIDVDEHLISARRSPPSAWDFVVMDYLISEGADLNRGLLKAIRNSDIYLAEYLIFKGANNFNEALELLTWLLQGYDQRLYQILDYLKFKIANPNAEPFDANPDVGLTEAVSNLNLYEVKHYVNKGADNVDEVFERVVGWGYERYDRNAQVTNDIKAFLRSKLPKPPPNARRKRRR